MNYVDAVSIKNYAGDNDGIRLEPCPFCGKTTGAIAVRATEYGIFRYSPLCLNCMATIGGNKGYQNEQDAALAWNMRGTSGAMQMSTFDCNQVRQMREALGLTRAELARESGISVTGLQRIEKNPDNRMQMGTKKQLMEALRRLMAQKGVQ